MATGRRAFLGELGQFIALATSKATWGKSGSDFPKNPWALGKHEDPVPKEVRDAENEARFRAYIKARKSGKVM